MMNYNITFGKPNYDGTKAVYITNSDSQRMFAFWFDPQNDNPSNLKPTQAVTELIQNAGYDDVADFFTTRFPLAHKQS